MRGATQRMEEYEPIKVLGEGSFGKVYLMKHSKTRDLVCTKVRGEALAESTQHLASGKGEDEGLLTTLGLRVGAT